MLRETMDCQRIADGELVEKYLNGRLDPALQDDLEIHLLSCPHCLAHAETLKTIRAGLATVPQEAPGAAARKFWTSGWGRVGIAAAVLILVAAGVYLFRQSSRKPAQTANTPTEVPPNTPVAPRPRNEAGSEQHASDHPAQRAEKKNPRPEIKPGRDSREAEGPKVMPETQVATSHPTPVPSSTPSNARKEPASPGMSEEGAVELYRLAAVQAPPYTFNQPGGSTGPGTEPGAKPSSSFSSMTGPGRAFFQQAMLAYVEGHYEDAAHLLEKTVQSQPRAVPANFYLGVCRLLQGHPSESVAPLKEVLAAPASSFTQSAHFYLAKAYLQMSQLEDAEREMQAAAALSGNLTAEAQSLAARIHELRDHAGR
ncbi:MAG: tetratricopeptide repeat protein [Acidobacteriia bacterium]|nr:tetratricopeptide repeat protein [Terriglobia bacterium]